MNIDDVGKVFRKTDGTYWVMSSYLREPGIAFQSIETGEKTIMVGVSSLIAQEYEQTDLPDELAETLQRIASRAQLDKDKLR